MLLERFDKEWLSHRYSPSQRFPTMTQQLMFSFRLNRRLIVLTMVNMLIELKPCVTARYA